MANPSSILFTHHKCGSSWLAQILEGYCAATSSALFRTHLSQEAPLPSAPCDVLLFTNSDYEFCTRQDQLWMTSVSPRMMHVIRNPLDLVVSAYYSHLSTHSLHTWPELAQQRSVLERLDKHAGMMATWVFLERSDFYNGATGPLFAMRRWDFDDERMSTVRLEDLVADHEYARAQLQDLLGGDPGKVMSDLTFEKLSGGRARGEVDNRHHYRTGAAPDQWRQEMEPSLARAIYEEYRALIDRFYPAAGATIVSNANAAG